MSPSSLSNLIDKLSGRYCLSPNPNHAAAYLFRAFFSGLATPNRTNNSTGRAVRVGLIRRKPFRCKLTRKHIRPDLHALTPARLVMRLFKFAFETRLNIYRDFFLLPTAARPLLLTWHCVRLNGGGRIFRKTTLERTTRAREFTSNLSFWRPSIKSPETSKARTSVETRRKPNVHRDRV